MRQAYMLPVTALVLLLISGCTVPMNLETGNGVIIKEFEPKLTTIFSGETVMFQMRIKNTGSYETAGTASLLLSQWGGDCTINNEKRFSELVEPDPERGTEGQELTFTWECSAPVIDEGLHLPYKALAEVNYRYKTTTTKSVTLLPTDQMIAYIDSGKSLPTEHVSTTNSPLELDVQVKGPIRIREDSNMVEFPIEISIRNVGGGSVKDSKVNLEVDPDTRLSDRDCDQMSLDLYKGQTQGIKCYLTGNSVNFVTQVNVMASIEYDYSIAKETSIEVIGSRAAYR